MRIKTLGTTLALGFMAAAVCFASSQIGTWKLNEAKSSLAGMAKNHAVIYEAVGDDVKITVDGTGVDGKPVHNEWVGKFDGKDYPVTGDDAIGDARSYKTVDANTLEMTIKNGGKVTATGRIVLSADGKTRTVTLSRTDAQGKTITSTAVYDRQ
jgi:hypothetical protein